MNEDASAVCVPMFGVTLSEIMARPEEKAVIPDIVKKILLFLNSTEAITTEKLFGVEADAARILNMKQACERQDFDSLSDKEPHVVAGLLKLFLEQLPDPLLTFSLYENFIATTEIGEDNQKNRQLKDLVQQLPTHNKSLATVLFLFFARMAEFANQNKMTPQNMAMVFAPILLRPKADGVEAVSQGAKAVAVLQHIIEFYEQIFPTRRKEPTPTTVEGNATNNDSGEPSPEKMRQIVERVDEAISAVQARLAALQKDLARTDSMEEAIQIARKIRTAKRILIGGPAPPEAAPTKKAIRPTPNQLSQQLRRSASIAALANAQTAVSVQSGAASEQGVRKTMEDAHVAMDSLADILSGGESSGVVYSFYGVYDGHGGTEAAILTGQRLHLAIVTDPAFSAGRLEEALRNGYASADREILEAAARDGWKNGTTAVTALLMGRKMYIANVGDSEAILAKRKKEGGYRAVCVSIKHKPTEKSEKERIRNAGGHVVFGRVFGDLAVSRSLGDPEYKRPISDADYISAEPYVDAIELSHLDDDFLILACDGVWDVLSYQDATELVGTQRDDGCSPEECARVLVQTALHKGSKDNITAVVVFFNWV